jgi:hypothetical protein
VSGKFEVGKFRLATPAMILPGIMIALGLTLNTGPARAEMPQCKLVGTSSFNDLQSADWTTVNASTGGMGLGGEGYWDNEIAAVDYGALHSGYARPDLLFLSAILLANSYGHEGKFPDAIAEANAALKTHVNDSVAYEERAAMEFYNHDMADAISDATQSLALDSCQKQAYVTRGDAYRREHLAGQASADEARVLAIDTSYIAQKPEDEALYLTHGWDEDCRF